MKSMGSPALVCGCILARLFWQFFFFFFFFLVGVYAGVYTSLGYLLDLFLNEINK